MALWEDGKKIVMTVLIPLAIMALIGSIIIYVAIKYYNPAMHRPELYRGGNIIVFDGDVYTADNREMHSPPPAYQPQRHRLHENSLRHGGRGRSPVFRTYRPYPPLTDTDPERTDEGDDETGGPSDAQHAEPAAANVHAPNCILNRNYGDGQHFVRADGSPVLPTTPPPDPLSNDQHRLPGYQDSVSERSLSRAQSLESFGGASIIVTEVDPETYSPMTQGAELRLERIRATRHWR